MCESPRGSHARQCSAEEGDLDPSDRGASRQRRRIPSWERCHLRDAFSSHFWTDKAIGWVQVNGQPAATLTEDGEITTLVTLTASADGIAQLLWVMSPQKLGHVTAVGA
nr:hypothetical protein [uncultured Microbacterium sp.]